MTSDPNPNTESFSEADIRAEIDRLAASGNETAAEMMRALMKAAGSVTSLAGAVLTTAESLRTTGTGMIEAAGRLRATLDTAGVRIVEAPANDAANGGAGS